MIAAAAGLLLLMKRNAKTESDFEAYKIVAEADIEKYSDDAADKKSQLDALIKQKSELEAKLSDLEKEKAELIVSFENKDALYRELNGEIEKLNGEISDREADIEELKETISELEEICRIDLNEQVEILNELYDLLENQRPIIPYAEEQLDENGEPILNENGEIVYVQAERVPRIALYYEDLNRGYIFGYNEAEVFDSASLIKAPFSLAILDAAEKEAEKLRSENIDEKNGGNTDLADANIMGLSDIFVYTKDHAKSGSGIIIEGEENTEFTYLELINYLLKYSDNVAFAQLLEKYGYAYLRNYVYEKNMTSMYQTLANMSAEDGGKIMKEIYNFIESGCEYSDFLYDSMYDSNYPVMIPAGVSPKKTIHKYGWDTRCYHDMAVVYDENPYVLVLLSDMDTGSREVNEYIQKIVGLIDRLHENFYS